MEEQEQRINELAIPNFEKELAIDESQLRTAIEFSKQINRIILDPNTPDATPNLAKDLSSPLERIATQFKIEAQRHAKIKEGYISKLNPIAEDQGKSLEITILGINKPAGNIRLDTDNPLTSIMYLDDQQDMSAIVANAAGVFFGDIRLAIIKANSIEDQEMDENTRTTREHELQHGVNEIMSDTLDTLGLPNDLREIINAYKGTKLEQVRQLIAKSSLSQEEEALVLKYVIGQTKDELLADLIPTSNIVTHSNHILDKRYDIVSELANSVRNYDQIDAIKNRLVNEAVLVVDDIMQAYAGYGLTERTVTLKHMLSITPMQQWSSMVEEYGFKQEAYELNQVIFESQIYLDERYKRNFSLTPEFDEYCRTHQEAPLTQKARDMRMLMQRQ